VPYISGFLIRIAVFYLQITSNKKLSRIFCMIPAFSFTLRSLDLLLMDIAVSSSALIKYKGVIAKLSPSSS
jgi:hypothetical protein